MKEFKSFYPTTYEISLHPLTICNQKCEYCYARKYMSWNKMWSKKQLEYILNEIKKISISFNIEVVGGEPLLYPHLNYLLKELCQMNNCKEIDLATNASKDLSKVYCHHKICFNLSYHPSTIISEEIFLKNVKYVSNLNHNISMMMEQKPESFEKIHQMVKKVKRYTSHIMYNIITDGGDDVEMDTFDETEDLEGLDFLLIENGKRTHCSLKDVYEKHLNRLKGWKCRLEQASIYIDGTIYRGCISGGNIFETPGLLGQVPEIICQEEECPSCCWLLFPKKKE